MRATAITGIRSKAILLGIDPAGRTLVTVNHADRDELELRRVEDGSLIATIAAGCRGARIGPT